MAASEEDERANRKPTPPKPINRTKPIANTIEQARDQDRANMDREASETVSAKGAAKTKSNTQESANTAIPPEDRGDTFTPPPGLAKRFLKAGRYYHFRDDHQTLAFEDRGEKLATDHQDPDVARSMVELAQAKGWKKLDLKGTEEFKREAWLEATLRGLETTFQPKEVDVARLKELQGERSQTAEKREQRDHPETSPQNKEAKEPVDERKLSPQQSVAVEALRAILKDRGDSAKQIDAAIALTTERFQNNRVYVGKVIEHGAAAYEFDKKNEPSHFVRLETTKGEKMVWGVDLKRALHEGDIKKGDDIAIAYQGKKQVTITIKDRDDTGQIIGERTISTNRNEWAAEKIEKLRADAVSQLNVNSDKGTKRPQIKTFDSKAQSQVSAQTSFPEQRASTRSR